MEEYKGGCKNRRNNNKNKPSDVGRWTKKNLILWMNKCLYLFDAGYLNYDDYIRQTGEDMPDHLRKVANGQGFYVWMKER